MRILQFLAVASFSLAAADAAATKPPAQAFFWRNP